MMYLCRKGHFTEVSGGRNNHSIFCNSCRKSIPKYKTYAFQQRDDGLFLSRQSEPPYGTRKKSDPLEIKRKKARWRIRLLRLDPIERKRLNELNKMYRARKKAKQLADIQA